MSGAVTGGAGGSGLIVHNAKVITCDPSRPGAEAVGMVDGKVRAVGDTEAVRQTVGRGATELDAGGRTVVPGFIDAHNHFISTTEAFNHLEVRYPEVASIADLQGALDAKAERTPPGDWIHAFAMDYAKYTDGRLPTRDDLDAITSEHPVIVLHQSGHFALVNSRALELRGVGDNVSDPVGGSFERDAGGRPTGLLRDTAMNAVLPVELEVGCHGPNYHVAMPLEQIVQWLDAGTERYLAAGLTTVCDPQVTRKELRGYREAYKRGLLRIRTVMMPLSVHIDELETLGLAGPFGDDMLRIGAMKLYSDGTLIGGTAWFSTPYGEHGEFAGTTYWKPAELNELVRRAHVAGWQVGIHTNGDAAMDMSLDAIEHAMLSAPRVETRHRIEHCTYPTPAQQIRMAALGVIPVHQPNFLVENGDEFLPRFGERAHHLKPFRDELERGLKPVISSDSFVASFHPLDSVAAAMTRRTRSGQPIGPEQALTLDEALRAHTLDAAYSIRMEDKLGSIEPGKLGDLTIVDGDLRATPADQIPSLGIWKTVVGGNVAWTS